MRRQKRGKKFLKKLNLVEILVIIGKPIYLVFFYTFVLLLLLPAALGKVTRLLVKRIKSFRIKRPRLKLRILRTKVVKIKLPKIKLMKPKRVEVSVLRTFLTILAVAVIGFWFSVVGDLPSPRTLVTRDVEVSTKIYDRNGILLYKIFEDENRTLVKLEQIPEHVRRATLAAEDAEFYSHPGYSLRGIVRSLVRNMREGKLSGGSTITQQLVKNALLTPEKTLVRKIREVILSMQVEGTFSKDEILEMYLNEVSYGGTAYGIQEASQSYFGKNVWELTLAEAAYLAGLPKSPSRYSPFGPTPEAGYERQKEVLRLMEINKFINKDELTAAISEKLTFAPNKTDIKAPHFVMYVRQLLAQQYGEEVVEKGGLEVVTTLDYNVQKMAEEVVSREVTRLSRLRVGNGAALVTNPKTGEILAMVGSKDFFDVARDGQVNVTTALRQPGSSIKVVNYAYALSHGYTPASILDDTPVTFQVAGQPPYIPKNYDSKFRGKITLRSALAESRNIPAVRLLASYGVNKMIELGREMGIDTWIDPTRYGLSLTLGGGEVHLTDLAEVFGTIANYGERVDLSPVLKVTNYKGKVLTEFETPEKTRALPEAVAYQLIDILKDNSARSASFGNSSFLVVAKHPEVAVKTGTSNNLRDNLTVGFSPDYLVAVWVGNNDNSPMSQIASGVTGAAPIWNEIIKRLLVDKIAAEWPVPEGLVRVPICTLTGTLACQGCPTRMEWFLKEAAPSRACNPLAVEHIKEEKRLLDERRDLNF